MSSTTYKVCSKCGAHLVLQRETTGVCTSPMLNTPKVQYRYVCPECGNVEYDSKYYNGNPKAEDKDFIEIPFGAKDSEMQGWTYTIPEGFTAKIEDGKIIVSKAESEDERIREWLIEECQKVIDIANPAYDTSKAKKAIAWLKRQKEQKPKEWSEDIIRKAVKEVGLTQHQIDWFKTNVFPPKQEWSEKDKEIIDWACCYLGDYAASFKDKNERKSNMLYELSSKLNSLRPQPKCLPGFDEMTPEEKMNHPLYLEGFDAGREVGKVETEQPKQEWSEEEEEMLDAMIDIVSNSLYEPLCPREGMLAWLNSLKNRGNFLKSNTNSPCWKPSEEQMNSLNFGIHALEEEGYDETAREIKELYEQLKKLMEE